jgi:hypothetical protein
MSWLHSTTSSRLGVAFFVAAGAANQPRSPGRRGASARGRFAPIRAISSRQATWPLLGARCGSDAYVGFEGCSWSGPVRPARSAPLLLRHLRSLADRSPLASTGSHGLSLGRGRRRLEARRRGGTPVPQQQVRPELIEDFCIASSEAPSRLPHQDDRARGQRPRRARPSERERRVPWSAQRGTASRPCRGPRGGSPRVRARAQIAAAVLT